MTDISPTVTAPTLWNYDLCGQYPGAVGAGTTVHLACKSELRAHRYLIVQFPIKVQAHFCELEVYLRSQYYYICNRYLRLFVYQLDYSKIINIF